MCGICGAVSFRAKVSQQKILLMNNGMIHRGPDAGGLFSFTNCILGHRRLSILDLSEAANQPMVSEDGKTAIVFNGEIYNFQNIRRRLEKAGVVFRTTSDTEALLELYRLDGADMLDQLNGMFSFAIWDDNASRLFVARDRLGKKPLYYAFEQGVLYFASELNAILKSGLHREFSSQALHEYLLYDFIPAPHTILRNVQKLPAGHTATFGRHGLSVKRYWDLPEPMSGMDYTHSRAELAVLLEDAVSLRLISDVPLGAFLSGGLDSTLITALMAQRMNTPVKTFSIGFPGTSHDESHWARLGAAHVGSDHTAKAADFGRIRELFPRIVSHLGEPFADSSALPTWMLCEHTRSKVTVALSGDGGDELFAGYERYLARRLQSYYELLPGVFRRQFVERLARFLPSDTEYYGVSYSKKLKLFLAACNRLQCDPLALVPNTFTHAEIRRLTDCDYVATNDPVPAIAAQWMGLDPVSRMMFADIKTYLAEDILTKVDRMSMAHALEVRSPLLDYRIVELACKMPLRFKMNAVSTKRILRDCALGLVPQPIIERKKYGFQAPFGLKIKGELKDWCRTLLIEKGRHGIFDPKELLRIWRDHQENRADNAWKIWSIVVFNEWLDQATAPLVLTAGLEYRHE